MKTIKSINIGDVFASRLRGGCSIRIININPSHSDISVPRFICEYCEFDRVEGIYLLDYYDIVERYYVWKEEDKNSFNKRCIIEKSQPEELPF